MAVGQATTLDMLQGWRWITTNMTVRRNTKLAVGQTTKFIQEQAAKMVE